MSALNFDAAKPEFEKIVTHLRGELATLRGTRATPALVDEIPVEAYGARQALKTLASMSVPDPRTLVIEPWDKTVLKDIERAIQAAGKGLNPVNEGNLLRIVLPPLTEETRRELAKIVSKRLEEARSGVRNVREKLRAQILEAEKKKEIVEDETFRQLEKLEEIVGKYNGELQKVGEAKEKEIMTV